MEIEVIKKLIRDHLINHTNFIVDAAIGRRYYEGDTDILYGQDSEEDINNPLRNADNRIPTNYQGLLVDQKAAYMLTYPPTFDIGDDGSNKRIRDTLGDEFPKVCKDLCIEAANTGVGWVHVWKSRDNRFEYALVPSEQIIPLYSKDLKKRLIAVLRTYSDIDDNGDSFIVYEYWTDKECYAYKQPSDKDLDYLEEYSPFISINLDTDVIDYNSVIAHGFEEVPFIPFFNNNIKKSDLKKVKKFIDVYDKVFSGFINDLDDIQELIFVLTNYGGTNLSTFLQDLKKHKVVDMQSDGADEKTGLDTVRIDIPVEAREKVLDICEKQIYKQGQGVDPNPEAFGNSSGIALEYLYSLLELKAGLTETEFRLGFGTLVRLLCKHLNISVNSIDQTWTRNKIRNDVEAADIAQKSVGIVPKSDILKNHPLVEDPVAALKELEEEEKANLPLQDKVPIGGGDNVAN